VNLIAVYESLLLARARDGVFGDLQIHVTLREYGILEFEMWKAGRRPASAALTTIEIHGPGGRIVFNTDAPGCVCTTCLRRE